jgi:hypothetical protein
MRWQTVVRVLADPVVPLAALPRRIHVNRHAAEVWQVMQQLVSHLIRNVVAIGH